jgi:hypothetical protein
MVYHEGSKDDVVIRIERDEPFIQAMKEDLQAFYTDFMKQALLENFFFRS